VLVLGQIDQNFEILVTHDRQQMIMVSWNCCWYFYEFQFEAATQLHVRLYLLNQFDVYYLQALPQMDRFSSILYPSQILFIL